VQEVKLDKNIKLLDSPGIVISKEGDAASLVLKNCVRVSRPQERRHMYSRIRYGLEYPNPKKSKPKKPKNPEILPKNPMGLYFLGFGCPNPFRIPWFFSVKISGHMVHHMGINEIIF
jgi:hypothetical protein